MSIENNGYNGWTNYATWRVRLELFDGATVADITGGHPDGFDRDSDAYQLQKALKEHAEYIICEQAPEGLARDYALAFLSDVNWRELADDLLFAYAESHPDAYSEDAE